MPAVANYLRVILLLLYRWNSAQQPGFVLPADGSYAGNASQGAGQVPPDKLPGPAGIVAAEQETAEPHWGLGVYQRVFLTESAAQAWYNWNSMRGDPAQPYHYHDLVQRVQQQVMVISKAI